MRTEPEGLILIVDNELDNLSFLSTLLTDSGFRVLTATSEADAYQKLGQIVPDIILLEAMMSGIDGFELCRHIKLNPQFYKVPVILMVDKNYNQSRLAELNLELVDYLAKPFLPIEIFIRIRLNLQLLSLSRSLHESNHQLHQEIIARQTVEAELHNLNQGLEDKVIERTQALTLVLNELQIRGKTHLCSFS